MNGRHETSHTKEHFKELLKAVRDETRGKMSPDIVPVFENMVEKRALMKYDSIIKGDKDECTVA